MAILLLGFLLPTSAAHSYQTYLSDYDAPYQHSVQAGGGNRRGASYEKYFHKYMSEYGSGAGGGYEDFLSKYAGSYASKYVPSLASQSEKSSGANQPVNFAGQNHQNDKKHLDDELQFERASLKAELAAEKARLFAELTGAKEAQKDRGADAAEAAAVLTGQHREEQQQSEEQQQEKQRLRTETAVERAHLQKELTAEQTHLQQELAAEAEQERLAEHRRSQDQQPAAGPASGAPASLAILPSRPTALLLCAGALAAGALVAGAAARLWCQRQVLVEEADDYLIYVEGPLDIA